MKVKDLRTFPPFKEHIEKLMSGECDDYEVLVQLNGNPMPMSFINVDDKVKTVWFAGVSTSHLVQILEKPELTEGMVEEAKKATAYNIKKLEYRDKHGHWPK